jgi:hypothetical protein
VHTLYRVFLCTVLLPVWGMPILYGLLSHQTVGIVCIIIIIIIIITEAKSEKEVKRIKEAKTQKE